VIPVVIASLKDFSFFPLTPILSQSITNCIKNMTIKKRSQNEPKPAVKKVRTSVSVSNDLLNSARQRATELRRGSFSNYIENLIADDLKEAQAA
jgi:hypothetical protein